MIAATCLIPSLAAADPNIAIFESGQVRPLASSPDGQYLFAVNTPDNRLEIFKIKTNGLEHRISVPVGLEPVSVAARTNGEIWVVNHLSDSISIVDLEPDGQTARVTRTLHVGDEPRDLVFAGPGRRRAFITTAHRGQNTGRDPQLTTPGVGRADVWVFDAADLGDELHGTSLAVITLFADTPRALAVTPDGATVYAAAFHSGNRTTIATDLAVPAADQLPPLVNFEGVRQPRVGHIVSWNGVNWVDELARVWDHLVNLRLPDKDVFAIDAMASVPRPISGPTGVFTGVGTVLYNMVVNPVSGKIYVTNTEALNTHRFEGVGSSDRRTIRGHHNENRITVIEGDSVLPRHLNKHIDYATCCAPVPNPENALSLALPMGMAISGDGERLYVAAMGSSKVAVFDTGALENDSFWPSLANQIAVTGGGPTGLVLNESRGHLYVLTRFDNSISVIRTSSKQEIQHLAMPTPEPTSVTAGRRFLYDASLTSSHGDSTCASCHVFGDFDSTAWDLGNPDDTKVPNHNPLTPGLAPDPVDTSFFPLKGPLVTQSLRGMANHGPMHWRGDRTGASLAPSIQPDRGAYDEREAFRQFHLGIENLLGRPTALSDADMRAFTDFILKVSYPPNPIRNLDNSLTPQQAAGRDIYFTRPVRANMPTCQDCHTLDPKGNAQYGVEFPGFFGSDGRSSRTGGRFQMLKVPHLRNMYQKVGMFGFPDSEHMVVIPVLPLAGLTGPMGDQVRGFGFLSAGDFDSLARFHGVFDVDHTPGSSDIERRQLEAFMFAFDSNHAPIVGQQVTLSSATESPATRARIELLIARAEAGECDLVAKVSGGSRQRGYLYRRGGMFLPDTRLVAPVAELLLRFIALLPGQETTYTCVPVGSGRRVGVDRDLDGILDRDE